MADASWRFSGVGGEYDAVRPRPPADLLSLITQWAGLDRPDVVDLGAGTGLSAVVWAGSARQVTAVEPSADMRRLAERRIAEAAAGSATRFTVLAATAEDTGLPDGCADVVTASQAMHWFDPDRALPEIARLLRPGGVLAAYDCDWPPWTDWETAAAWERVAAGSTPSSAGAGSPKRTRARTTWDGSSAAGCSGTAPRSPCTGATRATPTAWWGWPSARSRTPPASWPTAQQRISSVLLSCAR